MRKAAEQKAMTYREEIEGGGLSSSSECSRTVTTVNRLLRGVAALLCGRPPAAPQPSAPAIVDLSKCRAQTIDSGGLRALNYSPANVRTGWRCQNLGAVDTSESGCSRNQSINRAQVLRVRVPHYVCCRRFCQLYTATGPNHRRR